MYRLIDIPISNCINSQVNQVYVLTQFMSASLHSHLRRAYSFDQFSGGFVELLAAQETASKGSDWYQGTADAVRKNLNAIDNKNIDYVLILSGDQLYQMDYRQLINSHRRSGADVSISCMPVDEEAARGFGVMNLDDDGRVTGFLEKPQTKEDLDIVRNDPAWIDSRGIASKGREFLASMGIYVFNRDVLLEVLTKTDYRDFGKEVFPATIRTKHVQTHMFDGYWEDIGTIKSFYDANLSLAGSDPPFSLSSQESKVYTRARFLPPTRMGDSTVKGSLIANGCRFGNGVTIENSVIGLRTCIGDNVTIKDSIIMGNDFYETDRDQVQNAETGVVQVGIGSGSQIVGAIVDKNCRLGTNVKIENTENIDTTNVDHPLCVIRDGIPVLVKNAEFPDNWSLKDLS
jgi:glucose-1-phosphate adenylyltransferase